MDAERRVKLLNTESHRRIAPYEAACRWYAEQPE